MRRFGLTLAVLLIGGCGSSLPPQALPIAPAPPPPPPPPAPIAVYPGPISVPPPPLATPDQCGARQLQGLVGRPRTEIPVTADLRNRRVLCTTCPRTMDFDPQRLTIEYDTGTNRVMKVACG